MKEAALYTRSEAQETDCQLCAHRCRINDGKFGFCAVRQNVGGILYTHNYGKLVASNPDPVEKKPLYHFLPGSDAFSIACAGCNFRCGFCQNWQISQANFINQSPGEDFSAENVIKLAKQNNCKSIAYTYTEPTIYFEFALEVMKLAKEAGLFNIFVTNGYMTKEASLLLGPYLDAANIDLKFFKESSYQKISFAKLKPVLDSINLLHDLGAWVEVTTLIIPGENDTPEELSGIANFIAALDANIPWHISRFHADYRFDNYASTSEAALKAAYELGKARGLHYIYAGNTTGWGQDTFCSRCKKLLIRRVGFDIAEFNLSAGKCLFCQAPLPGVYV
ncbi:MAG: AmmeMemoRadiSam system radical SAM enzyme [Candidatus Omnitrophica bacterium]|nr:AmmeMemoRadiSam system radical SAM enzyme [Candidatus Omnitrophota bacterium]